MEPWEHALTYIGTPFSHRGRTRNRLDCAGLLVAVGRDMGYRVRDLRIYGRVPYDDGLERFLESNCGPPVTREPQVNDILLLRHRPELPPGHLALVTPHPSAGGLGMVHTYGELGKVVNHILNDTWRRKIVAVYEWPSLNTHEALSERSLTALSTGATK